MFIEDHFQDCVIVFNNVVYFQPVFAEIVGTGR